MEKTFGLYFHLKKTKDLTESDLPVYMRITIDGQACEVSAKMRCEPDKWNVEAGRFKGKNDLAREYNACLDIMQQKVFEAKRKLTELDKPLTVESIKTLLHGKKMEVTKRMLMEIFQHHNDQLMALAGKDYADGTIERYKTSYKHTQSFLEFKYKVKDIDITKLNFEFITEYEFWLKSVRRCAHNSTIKYLANFRKIINRCIRNGWLQRDPFLGFSMAKKEVERTALTELELKSISSKKFSTERLALVRDIFLFSCFSGLAYADVKKLKRSEIITGVDGGKWIISRRQKTDISYRIPILPVALNILEKYEDHPHSKYKDTLLPILSNQKMNAYLKEIAELCGISQNLTYHIARHTFATTITLSNGVPLETVSKILGHRNLKTTQQYAKILDHKISKDLHHLHAKYQEL